jgi:hypothetical protein
MPDAIDIARDRARFSKFTMNDATSKIGGRLRIAAPQP